MLDEGNRPIEWDASAIAALLHQITYSPLPTVVLDSPDGLANPRLVNFSFAQLSRGAPFVSLLTPASVKAVADWLARPLPQTPPKTQRETFDPSSPEDDLELDLHLGSAADGTDRLMNVVWRRSTLLHATGVFHVLTALMLPPKRLSRLSGSSVLDAVTRKIAQAEGGREKLPVEQQLRELELLYARSAVGLARLDLEGRVLAVNESWLKLTDHKEGRPLVEWSQCLDVESYDKLLIGFKECRKNLVPLVGRFRLTNGNYVLAHCTPNNVQPDLVTGWISNLTDVTDQVKAEEAVGLLALERERAARQAEAIETAEERRREAEEQRRAQELLIDVTSHEVRNPTNAILQNAELIQSSLARLRSTLRGLLEEGRLPPELAGVPSDLDQDIEAIESVGDAARSQAIIADDILGLAQIGANKYTVTPVPFALIPALKTTIKIFQTEARSKDVELTLEVGPLLRSLGENVEVEADPVRLKQVLTNLISNAIRFTGTCCIRKVTLQVELSAEGPPAPGVPLVPPPPTRVMSDGGPLCLYFAVVDTGPGMTPEEVLHVFDRFMQANHHTHVEFGGSGLGLWIARNLCELQEGRIELVSTPRIGSVFRGYIRARHCPRSSPTPSLQTGRPSSRSALNVLVVDDNAINRTILVRQLTQAGHGVSTARDGREAVDLVCQGDFHTCVMDVNMPNLDGLSATRAIRAWEAAEDKPRLRIIGCTGNAREGQVQAALASGMDSVLTKPYRLPDLLQALPGPTSS